MAGGRAAFARVATQFMAGRVPERAAAFFRSGTQLALLKDISFFYIQLFNRKTTPNCNEFKVRKTGCSFSVVATTLNRNWLGVVADAAGLPTIPNQLRLGVVFQEKNLAGLPTIPNQLRLSVVATTEKLRLGVVFQQKNST